MKKQIMTQSGFSLIQVMVGLGLISIIGYGMMTMITNSYKHQTNLAVLLEGRELAAELAELTKSANCGISQLQNPIAIPADLFKDNRAISLESGISGRFLTLKAGEKYSRFLVNEVAITPYFDKTAQTDKYVAMNGIDADDFSGATIVKAALTLNVQAQDSPKAPVRSPIYLYLDPDRKHIIGCESSLEDKDFVGICASFGGSWIEEESRCQLPCPPGMVAESGICVSPSEEVNTQDVSCNVNERCKVSDKYIISI